MTQLDTQKKTHCSSECYGFIKCFTGVGVGIWAFVSAGQLSSKHEDGCSFFTTFMITVSGKNRELTQTASVLSLGHFFFDIKFNHA